MDEVEFVIRVILKARDEMAKALADARQHIRGMGTDAKAANIEIDKLNSTVTNLSRRMGTLVNRSKEVRSALEALARGESGAASEGERLEKTERSQAANENDLNRSRRQLNEATREHARVTSEANAQQMRFNQAEQAYIRAGKQKEDAARKRMNAADDELRSLREQQRSLRENRDTLRQETSALENNARASRANQQSSLSSVRADRQRVGGIQDLTGALERVSGSENRATRSTESHTRVVDRNRRTVTENKRGIDGWIQAIERFTHSAAGAGENVAVLDNRLRGMLVLAILVFAQQLISLLDALGGELVSVGASALTAGAALGGIFAAGIMQAIPVIGIFAVALGRLQNVMQAVKQSDLLQKQQFVQSEKVNKRQKDSTDRVANAQDSLRSATDGVTNAQDSLRTALHGVSDANDRVSKAQRELRDSQIKLNDARRDGRREIEDLIDAEKRAELAAKGAALSQAESARNLQLAIQRGGSLAEIQRAQLDVQDSRLTRRESGRDLTRARQDVGLAQRRGGVEGLESVRQARQAVQDQEKALRDARQGVDDANRAVTRAQRGVENAERAVARANRQIQVARRGSALAGADQLTAARSLNFFLSQLSQGERGLFNAIQRMRKFLGLTGQPSPFSGVTDTLIRPFTRGINRITDILASPKILRLAHNLASGVAGQLNRIQDVFLGDKFINQWARIANAGRKNFKPLGDIVINLGKSFANIAEAASPALNRLFKFISRLVGEWARFIDHAFKTGALEKFFNTGEKHLESWINLFVAIGKLFFALIGVSAPQGKKNIDELTKSVDRATTYVRTHAREVQRFLHNAHEVVKELLSVLFDLAKEMINAFNPGSVHAVGDLLRHIVVPALGEAVRGVGLLTRILATLADIPIVREFAKWAVVFLIFSKAVTGLTSVVSLFAAQTADFLKVFRTGPAGVQKLTNALSNYRGELGGVEKAQERAIASNEAFDASMAESQAAGAGAPLTKAQHTKAIGEAEGAAAAAAGPTGKFEKALGRLAPVARGAGGALAGLSEFLIGPWGLAIAAAVAAIVLILKHFGKLDDVGRALKKAWTGIKEALRGPLEDLNKAFGGSGANLDKLKKIVNDVGKVFAKVFASQIIFYIKEFGKILGASIGGAIRVLAGIIKIVRGVADVFIGLFTLDFDQVGRGFGRIWDGIKTGVRGLAGIGAAIIRYLTLPFRAVIKFIKNLFGIDSPSKFFIDLGRDIVRGLRAGITAVARILTAPFRAGIRLVGRIIDDVPDFVRKVVRALPRVLGAVGRVLSAPFRLAIRGIRSIVDDLPGIISRIFRRVINFLASIGSKIGGAAKDLAKTLVGAFKDVGGDIFKAIFKGVRGAANFVKEIINSIIGRIEDSINSIDTIGPLHIPDVHLPRLQEGGQIGDGYGGGDRILFLGEAGEHVWTKEEVAAAGGHPAMLAMRRIFGGGTQASGRGYQRGGETRAGKGKADDAEKIATGDLEDLLKIIESAGDKAVELWRNMWRRINKLTNDNEEKVRAQFRQMSRGISGTMNDIVDTVRRRMDRAGDVAANRASTLRRRVLSQFEGMERGVFRGFDYVVDATREALDAFGAKPPKISVPRPRDLTKAEGGWIGNQGERGRDLVPTWLGRGEYVLNWAKQKYLQARGITMDQLEKIRGFHAGGVEQPGFAAGGKYGGPGHSGSGFTPVWNMAKNKFGMTYFTGFDGHSPTSSTGNVSEHFMHRALDMGDGTNTPGEFGLERFIRTRLGPTISQLIWQAKVTAGSYLGGFIGDHFDHVHYSLLPQYAFNAGRMAKIIHRAMKGLSISDLLTGASASGVETEHVAKILVHGAGALKGMSQKAIDKVRAAANKFIDKKAGESDAFGGIARVASGPRAHAIFSFFRNKGISEAGAAGIVGNLQDESGFRTNAPEGGFQGIAQWDDNRWGKLVGFAQHRGLSPFSLKAQLNYIWYELTQGGFGGALSGIKHARNPVTAADIWMDRYEIASGGRGAREAFAKRFFDSLGTHAQGGFVGGKPLQKFAAGGIIGGQQGAAQPIIGHAGEWVLNELQQSKIAQWIGTTRDRLKGALGFTGGPMAFQGGGVIDPTELRGVERRLNRRKVSWLEWEDVISRMTWGALADFIHDAQEQIRKLKRGGVSDKEKGKIARLNKLLDLAKSSILDLPANLPLNMSLLANLGNRLLHGLGRLSTKTKGFFDKFIKAIDELTRDGGLISRMEEARQAASERLARSLTFATFRFVRAGRTTGRDPSRSGVGLRGNEVVRQVLSPTQIADQQLANSRSALTDIVGEEGIVSKSLRAVRRQLARAKKRGDADAVAKLQGQENTLVGQFNTLRNAHAEAIQSIFDAQVAAIQARIDAVTQKFEIQTGALDIGTRLAQAVGNTSAIAALNRQRMQVLTNEANALQKQIAAAAAIGDTDLVNSLNAQVADLRTQVFEIAQQMIADAQDAINNAAQRRLGRLDLINRMADALGRVGLGSIATVAGQSLSRGGVFTERADVLADQRAQLQELLNQTLSNPATKNNTVAINNLNDQIAELDVQIAENTKAFFQARVDEVNARADFSNSMDEAAKRIIELKEQLGVLTPEQSVAQQTDILNDRTRILQEQSAGLNQLLNEAIANSDTQAIQDLQLQLQNNEIAQLENTVAMQELTGQFTQPQGFASSAWQMFREAIFNGMGQVLPQFQVVPSAQSGAIVKRSGLVNVHSPELIGSPAQLEQLMGVGDNGDTFNIYPQGVDGELDYEHLGETVAFKKKNAKARGG